MGRKPTITCAKNGPLIVSGLETLVGAGEEYETKEKLALCRCGDSKDKPYCDGTHASAGFTDEKHAERVPDARADYVGKVLTIHDNRGLCAHAASCTRDLPTVFLHGKEPWIDPDGAAAEEIIKVVKSCPSGALSYSIDGVEHRDGDGAPKVFVAPKGPYAIQGGVELEGVEWGEGASREHYDLCRCGESKNKPFCDGSHWDSKFDGQ